MSVNNLVIGIVGAGVVGTATAKSLVKHVKEVRVYDKLVNKSTHSFPKTLESDLVFVCLPTPQAERGLGLDVHAIDEFFGTVAEAKFTAANIVLKSTVPIGTTKRLVQQYGIPNICHSPEFLTARTATEDAKNPRLVVIGSPYGRGKYTTDKTGVVVHPSCDLLAELYNHVHPTVTKCYLTSDESEALKLGMNSFFAVKVAFWNEFKTLTDKLGLDYHEILEGILAEGRVEPLHTQVPGPDGKYGFGGTCLPKDLSELINTMNTHMLDSNVTHGAYHRNKRDRIRGES